MALPTIVAQRSGLFYGKQRGGMPFVQDVHTRTGNVFFVMAGGTDSAGHGLHPDDPLATIDFAIGLCTANQGDLIIVMPGHTETLTAAITCDVAGVTILGLGDQNSRPAITVGGTIDGFDVTAADVVIENIRFPTPTAVATACINIASDRAIVRHCWFEQGANSRDAITVTAAGERPIIEDCFAVVTANGPDTFVEYEGVIDAPIFRRNVIIGSDGTNAYDTGILDFNSAAITNPATYDNLFLGGGAATTVVTGNGSVVGELTGPNIYAGSATGADNVSGESEVLDQLSGATGIPTWPAAAAPGNGVSIAEALRWLNDAVQGADGVVTFPNAAVPANGVNLAEVIRDIWAMLAGTAAGENGVQTWPAAAVPGNNVSLAEVLRDVWDALRNGTGGTEPGANKSIIDAIGFDGAAAVAASAGMLRVMAGTTFVVKKTLTSSAVVQAGVDVTAVSTVGDIAIEDWYLQANATGLAAGTNFTLETNNVSGASVFCSHAVASLGANTLVDKKGATTGKGTVLETGKKVIAKCTVADCTGAGTIDVYLICRRLADNATLSAA